MARAKYGPRCLVNNKYSFGSYKLAMRVARRISNKEGEPSHPYRCNVCGWYHVSSMTEQEASRHKARRQREMWQLRQEWVNDGTIQLPRAG